HNSMQRPVLYYFLLPFSAISIILYLRMLQIAWKKRNSIIFRAFFYKQTRSQAILDISYIVVYFLTDIPQDWPSLWHLLTDLNGSVVPQLIYCHMFICILG
ncbi:hypothetical protein PFISCL1PPCAC_14316, partial [Pristionchus fissidentatus]